MLRVGPFNRYFVILERVSSKGGVVRLELLAESARGRAEPIAFLFLHGICTSAAIWRPYLLPALAGAGYDCFALSFRGHGRSEGQERLAFTTLGDYVEDLERTLARLDRPVVAVGFSLGGAVLQAYLRRGHRLAGAVLMGSVPPYGLVSASLQLFFRDAFAWRSLMAANQLGLRHGDHESVRRVLFSNRIAPEAYAAFLAESQEESPLIGLQLQGWPPFAPLPWQLAGLPPMLVLGGGEDRLVPPAELRATATYYGADCRLLPGMPHMMMLEPDWRRAADAILEWAGASVSA